MIHDVNPALMQEIRRHGKGRRLEVESCFQCGNCTAVCPLAQDSAGFPRRAIRMAQVGMERELLASEDLWRCYACGECTRTCPREADPAEFMAAARSYAIARYDFTGLASLASRSVMGNLLVFGVLSTLFALLLLSRATPASAHLPFFDFIPGEWVHAIGIFLFAVVGLSLAAGLVSMVLRFRSERRREGISLRLAALPAAAVFAVAEALTHRRFRQCNSEEPAPAPQPWYRRPWVVHLSVMGGFVAMLLATTLDYLLKPIGSPVPPWYPMRVMGAVGGLICLYGLAIMLFRAEPDSEAHWRRRTFADWFFPVLLAVTVLTGLLTEILVYLPMTAAGHAVFFTHVVLAMDLVAMLPLTRFAHVLYRPLALALFAWRHAPEPHTAIAEA
ncbi:MAG: 4Fe-4S dicluster domain-containing protein [Acidobacteriaceae bacterium]